ncbi:MAG: CHAT domain-containing protein [Leptolyngbyaceae cyanobacterium]
MKRNRWEIAVLACLAWLLALSPALLANEATPPESFVTWCERSADLTPEARQTVDALLAVSGSADCQIAQDFLTTTTELDLTARQITDLSPLATLPQLTTLYAGQNQIADLTPLADLTNLTALYLLDNQVTDLRPLAALSRLTTLSVDQNQVQDLSPLAELPSLTVLFASDNQVRSLAPLANLTNLAELYVADNQIGGLQPLAELSQLAYVNLGNNQITTVEALANLDALIDLDLSENRLVQLQALASLANLNQLDLRNNPLATKACPVFPATVCVFSDDAAELYQTGAAQLDQAEFTAALTTFEAALPIYQTGGDRLRETDVLDRLGNAYDGLGQYANSLDRYQQAAAIRAQVGDRQGESDTLTNLGITYIRLGQTEKAVTALEAALAITTELTPRDRSWLRPAPREGDILSGLALAYHQLGEDAPALRYAQQSLASYRRGNDRTGEVIALVRVGKAYLNLGQVDKARTYLDKALELSDRLGDRANQARSLQALGDFSAQTGEIDAALARYEQALARHREIDNAPGAGETLNAMGALLLAAGQPQAAAEALSATVALWESLRPGLTDENKISIAETQAETYRLWQRSLIELGDREASLEASERGRGRAFIELLAHRLTLQGQALPTEQLAPPTMAQIRQLAQTQAVTLVEYAVVGADLYSWVVQPDGTLHFVSQSLEGQAIAAWGEDNRQALNIPRRGLGVQAAISGQTPEIAPAQDNLSRLYELLIEPIAPFLPTDSDATVVIVPQGELFLVPFAALVNRTGTALLEQHALAFAPALSLLTIAPAQTAALTIGSGSAVVVGNPTMPADPNTGQPLQPLFGAETEALAVAEILGTQPLIGDAAPKSAVMADIEQADIIHLATHGLLDDFGTGIPGVLALAPTSNDSGYLTAAEILDLSFTAQLAVLSACNTGQGSITGDGVVGLSRSLLTAGVNNVMVTLWSIPDEPTAVMMTAFYEALKTEPNRAIALRQAMLTTRAQYEHPTNWAAFTLYGLS